MNDTKHKHTYRQHLQTQLYERLPFTVFCMQKNKKNRATSDLEFVLWSSLVKLKENLSHIHIQSKITIQALYYQLVW